MRKSQKYNIKKLSRVITKQIFRGVEMFLNDRYFKKKLANYNYKNSFLNTIALGTILRKENVRRRTLFKLVINQKFPLFVEFNPNSCDMGECLPRHHVRINLANIDNYKDLRTTIIHELTHLFEKRDIKDFVYYSYEENPLEISAREMEDWFLNKFFFRKLLQKSHK